MPASPDNVRYFQLRKLDRQGSGKFVLIFDGADASDFTVGANAIFDADGGIVSGDRPFDPSGGYGSGYQQVPIGVMNWSNRDFYLDYVPLTFINAKGQTEICIWLQVNGVDQDPYFHFYVFPGTNHLIMRFPPKASDKEMVCRYFRGIPPYTPPPPGVPPPPVPPPPPPPLPPPPCGSITVTQLADCGLPHAYWRIFISETNSGGFGNAVAAAEVEFRGVFGGANLAVGGSAIASASIFSTPGQAFDGNPATVWSSAGSGPPGDWIGYHFPAPVSVAEFAWTSRNDSLFTFQNPSAFSIDWSDDGSVWTSIASITVPLNGSGDPCSWGIGETKVFSVCANAAPPPPPTPTATLTIWADYPNTPHGLPAVGYSLDGGLTWVGGSGTLPDDAGVQV